MIKSLLVTLISGISVFTNTVYSQNNYEIIESEKKQDIELNNQKTKDHSERIEIYYLYNIQLQSGNINSEKIETMLTQFASENTLLENRFNYNTQNWFVASRLELSVDEIKSFLSKSDFKINTFSEEFALCDNIEAITSNKEFKHFDYKDGIYTYKFQVSNSNTKDKIKNIESTLASSFELETSNLYNDKSVNFVLKSKQIITPKKINNALSQVGSEISKEDLK